MTGDGSISNQGFNNPLWPGPCLFVPITLECLVIGQPNQTGTWANMTIDYRQLPKAFDPDPKPFTTAAAPPQTGAYLQVTLPFGFRNGSQDPATGDVSFPAIPNRWLFLRWVSTNQGDAPVLTATVLQSDFLGAVGEGSNSYPDPDEAGQTRYIGRSFALADWTDPTSPAEPVLVSMGPGSVSWVSTYQNTRDVLCFYDALDDLDNGLVSYAALGWYSNSVFDPLRNVTDKTADGFTSEDGWNEIMSALRFSLGGAAGSSDAKKAWASWQAAHSITNPISIPAIQDQLASQSLCHGMVYGIDWKGPAANYPRDPILSGQHPLSVAVGGTGFEAIAAWLANELDSPDLEDLLLALQQDMVTDYLQEPSIFQDKSFGARFTRSDAGTVWLVAPAEGTDKARGKNLQTVNLSRAQTDLLTEVNAGQNQLDVTQQAIAGNAEELFALVYKLIQTPENPFGGNERRRQILDAISAVNATLSTLSAQESRQQQTLSTDLQALRAALGSSFNLSSTAGQRFQAPSSTSIMIAGAKQDTRFLPPDADGTGEDTLTCRFTGQTVTALTVSVPGASLETISANDLGRSINFPTLPRGLPKELDDYLVEVLLLDTANAGFLAKLAFAKAGIDNPDPSALNSLSQTIRAQQTAPFTATPQTEYSEQLAGAAVGFSGVVPMKRSVLPYSPAWSPLFIDWQVTWHPSAVDAAGMLTNWKLASIEFDWAGVPIPPATETIMGRTIIGTQVSAGLAAKLGDFTRLDPNFKTLPIYQQRALEEAFGEIQEFDIITGSLEAFGSTMLQKVSQITQLTDPDPIVQAYIQQAPSMVPLPGNGSGPGFYPLRAGHFTLEQLWIVDTFGQVLRATNPGETVFPVRSQSVTTKNVGGDDNSRYVQVAPSIQQDSRIRLRLLDAEDDTIVTNSSNLTNPVAGWLLPNHIDNSVLVFDQVGTPLGELLPVITDLGASIRWDPAPGTSVPLGQPPAIDNPHLLGFVNGLLTQAPISGDKALRDLLDVIDLTLWATAGIQQPADDNLAVLIGQAVAVVRADINLELSGPPAVNQSWADTGRKDAGGLPGVAFATHIGDINYAGNGVLGYFLNDDYSLLNPIRGFDSTMAAVRRALSGGDVQDRLAQALEALGQDTQGGAEPASIYLNADPKVMLKPDGKIARLTILMDPRGLIPVLSGILPVVSMSLEPAFVAAMNQLLATFRIGPILTSPRQVQMPLPGNVAGTWSWIARTGITTWETVNNLQPSQPDSIVPSQIPTLREGWLGLVPKVPVGGQGGASTVDMTFIERENG
ncbi:hypothetical protein J2T09_005408 [Neorhizobium huautlense]|uniref:Uncharacterized protein n=1 Tax=Neorhizobium huautlense TaxID=67774 RepID=A0ABT9Q2E4_9HYPH|nr:hypothetical protein [Neorhizobium huautlense]MDP9840620.1 hypothetical protein [Neorhizobium huautlense]